MSVLYLMAEAQRKASALPVVADYIVSPNYNYSLADLSNETLQPGDVVAFERGYSYHGSITINQSGTSAEPIRFIAFGEGSKPEITGLVTVNNWTQTGNVYESSSAISTLNSCNVVLIDGAVTPKGKLPKTGHFTIDSHVGHASLTSADLTGLTLSDKMEVLTKPDRWYLNVSPITSISGNTIYTSLSQSKEHHNGWGFWLQNHLLCLGENNENCYDSTTKKISVYHDGVLPTVQVGNIANLVTIVGHDYIHFEGLRFTGANEYGAYLQNARYISFQNCEFEYCMDAIYGEKPSGTIGNPLDSRNLTVTLSSIRNILDCGVWIDEDFGYATIEHTNFENIGSWHGLGRSNDGTYSGVRAMGAELIVRYCTLINIGYNPISFDGVNSHIYRNFIQTFNYIKDDGSAIYCARQNSGRVIEENIILNGVGTTFFLPTTSYDEPWEVLRAKGIYLDDDAQYVSVLNNTVHDVADNGLFLHGNHGDHILTGNKLSNCRGWNGIFSIAQDDPTADMANVIFSNNILVAYANGQRVCSAITVNSLTLTGYGTFENNYYCSPLDNEALMNYDTDMVASGSINTNLAGWRSALGVDANSIDPLISVASESDILFDYNYSDTVKTITLSGTYLDVDGVTRTGTYDIQPYSSVILFKQ